MRYTQKFRKGRGNQRENRTKRNLPRRRTVYKKRHLEKTRQRRNKQDRSMFKQTLKSAKELWQKVDDPLQQKKMFGGELSGDEETALRNLLGSLTTGKGLTVGGDIEITDLPYRLTKFKDFAISLDDKMLNLDDGKGDTNNSDKTLFENIKQEYNETFDNIDYKRKIEELIEKHNKKISNNILVTNANEVKIASETIDAKFKIFYSPYKYGQEQSIPNTKYIKDMIPLIETIIKELYVNGVYDKKFTISGFLTAPGIFPIENKETRGEEKNGQGAVPGVPVQGVDANAPGVNQHGNSSVVNNTLSTVVEEGSQDIALQVIQEKVQEIEGFIKANPQLFNDGVIKIEGFDDSINSLKTIETSTTKEDIESYITLCQTMITRITQQYSKSNDKITAEDKDKLKTFETYFEVIIEKLNILKGAE